MKPAPRARLLLVGDEQLIRDLYVHLLSLDRYKVEIAEDGVAGLERLAEDHFDLVLTERQMPRLDGVSMVLALRTAGSPIPVILIAASLTHPPLSRAISREFSITLPRPARRADLVLAVANALRPAPRRESLRSCGRNLIAA